MSYLDYIYNIVKLEAGGMDAIYKDYIITVLAEKQMKPVCRTGAIVSHPKKKMADRLSWDFYSVTSF